MFSMGFKFGEHVGHEGVYYIRCLDNPKQLLVRWQVHLLLFFCFASIKINLSLITPQKLLINEAAELLKCMVARSQLQLQAHFELAAIDHDIACTYV
ncbi:hypothetical protein CDAR_292351 [Caerostris darwini]|uniref:Uncharacterized protein n=1 Tax=Caerostris darwini TaxID=1538125 RepID=A0AAV4UD11_9ARAC|nr:hypothetical protein CDAR_292351 [Caerostris darwini]